MGSSSPLGNVKYFSSTRPPLVIFTLCLTAFALTTYSLAYFIKRAENIPNPDVHEDWNIFISHMAELDLCVMVLENIKLESLNSLRLHPHGSIVQSATTEGDLNNSSKRTNSVGKIISVEHEFKDSNEDNLRIVSFAVTASLSLMQELSTFPQNISIITGTLQAHQLKLNVADVVQNATLNVTFHLPAGIQNASQPQEICLTFEGPEHLFPSTKSPPPCLSNTISSEAVDVEKHTVKFISAHRGLPGVEETLSNSENGLELWCSQGSLMHMVYHPDPDLTVYLTMRDRSLINLHLLHTSYFLFVLAMTMVCYALIKGKPKQKLSFDKVSP